MKMKQTLAALSVVLMATAGTEFAANAQDNSWHFGATTPLWALGIDGDVTVGGHKQDLSIDFDKLKDHLETAISLGLEAHKDRFGLFGDFGYMKFTGDGTGAGGTHADAELKFIIADAGLSYLLFRKGEERPFLLAGTAGVRYWHTETDLTLTGPGGGLTFNGGQKRDLFDPVIGLRASQYLTRKLHVDASGDVGGFDISHKTDFTWSTSGLLSYDFAKWFTLSAGYKALALDVSEGSGANKGGVDLIFHGAILAATFKF